MEDKKNVSSVWDLLWIAQVITELVQEDKLSTEEYHNLYDSLLG